jgi:hypothetical protein
MIAWSGLGLGLGLVAVTACGLDLSGAAVDDAPDAGSSGSSGTSGSSGGSSSSSGSSSGSPSMVDSGMQDTGGGLTDSGATRDANPDVPPSPSSPCDGKPTPNTQDHGRCYWLSTMTTLSGRPEQKAACGVGNTTFIPIISGLDLSDYEIPGRLLGLNQEAWTAGRYKTNPLPGTWNWEWEDLSQTPTNIQGSSTNACLIATKKLNPLDNGDAVPCSQATPRRVVCQSAP